MYLLDVFDWKTLLLLFVIFFVLNIIYVFATIFEKTITIDEKNTYGSNSNNNQRISDTDGNIYIVKDSLIMMQWSSIELFNKLDVGKKFKIKGYGIRVPFLGMIPTITNATEIK